MSTSIAEVGIAIKLARLAERCGLKASDVDGSIHFCDLEESTGEAKWGDTVLGFVSGQCEPSEKLETFFNLLGMSKTKTRVFHRIHDLEELIDSALARAPRGRSF